MEEFIVRSALPADENLPNSKSPYRYGRGQSYEIGLSKIDIPHITLSLMASVSEAIPESYRLLNPTPHRLCPKLIKELK